MPDVDGKPYVYLAGPDVFYPDPKNRARLMSQVGVILWPLSASAYDWLPRETTHAALRSPVIGVLESQWDFGSSAVEARILRPLVSFGLLASRSEGRSATELVERRVYRKAPLFDRFLKFDVQVEGPDIRR